MAKISPLLQVRLDQLVFIIICGLFMPSPLTGYASMNAAYAFTAPQARIAPGRSMMASGKHIGAKHHGQSSSSLDSMQIDCLSTRCESYSRRSVTVRKPRKRKLLTKSMTATSIIASLFLACKPASAAPNISSATNLLSSAATTTTPTSSYNLTRILFLRMLAIVYTAAFSVAKFQNRGLIGDRGITPARNILNAAEQRGEAKSTRRKEWLEDRKKYTSSNDFIDKCKNKVLDSTPANIFRDKFWNRTDRMDRPIISLLWLARDRNNLNPWLDGLANVGLFLSTIMLATGSANALLILGLWLIQRSFMSVGGQFYGYGWEPQLAELTFHALFLVPLLSMNPFFGSGGGGAAAGAGSIMGAFPVSTLAIWAIRFYLFKIMVGAGLIKMKSSDPKWKPGDMSAMDYFYETQVSLWVLSFFSTIRCTVAVYHSHSLFS